MRLPDVVHRLPQLLAQHVGALDVCDRHQLVQQPRRGGPLPSVFPAASSRLQVDGGQQGLDGHGAVVEDALALRLAQAVHEAHHREVAVRRRLVQVLRLAHQPHGHVGGGDEHAVAALAQRAPGAVSVTHESQRLLLLEGDPRGHVVVVGYPHRKIQRQQDVLHQEGGEHALPRGHLGEEVLLERVGAVRHEEGVVGDSRDGHRLQRHLPEGSDAVGAGAHGPAHKRAELPHVQPLHGEVVEEAHERGQRPHRAKQGDVPKLQHHRGKLQHRLLVLVEHLVARLREGLRHRLLRHVDVRDGLASVDSHERRLVPAAREQLLLVLPLRPVRHHNLGALLRLLAAAVRAVARRLQRRQLPLHHRLRGLLARHKRQQVLRPQLGQLAYHHQRRHHRRRLVDVRLVVGKVEERGVRVEHREHNHSDAQVKVVPVHRLVVLQVGHPHRRPLKHRVEHRHHQRLHPHKEVEHRAAELVEPLVLPAAVPHEVAVGVNRLVQQVQRRQLQHDEGDEGQLHREGHPEAHVQARDALRGREHGAVGPRAVDKLQLHGRRGQRVGAVLLHVVVHVPAERQLALLGHPPLHHEAQPRAQKRAVHKQNGVVVLVVELGSLRLRVLDLRLVLRRHKLHAKRKEARQRRRQQLVRVEAEETKVEGDFETKVLAHGDELGELVVLGL
mmetsp:Transcript_8387/g.15901  ORF Transcript_8387/g.15901 Transcript_8387/m.15901 type:complete len:671 (+) Transcript_8387:1934-3946(+)